MPCMYANNCDGLCTMATNHEGEYDPQHKQGGCDDEGNCIVGDDPDPSHSCETYESDWSCYDCGVDLNVGECECEEE